MRKSPRHPYNASLKTQQTSFSTLLDALEPEREAQRQEYLRKMKKSPPVSPQALSEKPKKPKKTGKLKGVTFEEKLEKTQQWLKETFPDLFDCSPPKALDVHIVRDIKDHYKQGHVKNKYPADLVIKAALYRYMETPEYLKCLEEGCPRYNMEGQIAGTD